MSISIMKLTQFLPFEMMAALISIIKSIMKIRLPGVLALLILSAHCPAEVYKSKDAAGNVTFSNVDPSSGGQVYSGNGNQGGTVSSTRTVTNYAYSRFGAWASYRTTQTYQVRSRSIASGSGFRVANSLIVTSKHLVHDCSQVMINNQRAALQVALSGASDLALLRDGWGTGSLVKFRSDEPALGEPVFVGGYMLPNQPTDSFLLSPAQVQGKAAGNDPHMFELSGKIVPGARGGPVLDQAGHLIGMVGVNTNTETASHTIDVSSTDHQSPAIKNTEIIAFLKAYNIDPLMATATQPVSQSAISGNLEHAMVTISCYR